MTFRTVPGDNPNLSPGIIFIKFSNTGADSMISESEVRTVRKMERRNTMMQIRIKTMGSMCCCMTCCINNSIKKDIRLNTVTS